MYKRSEVEIEAMEYFKDSLVANVWLDKYALKISDDEYLEHNPDDTIKRMAGELSRIEQTYPNPISYEEIYDLLKDYNKFVLGGSCLFGIGNNTTLSTLGNCFVVDSPIDSYGGILKTDQELAQLMKRRGGVGVDLSTIRPRAAKVNNAASSSTGSVPFAERFSNTTREVAQEGRRGALMISMDINHDDVEEFIMAKDNLSKLTGANISVRVDDKFMNAVENKEDSQLKIWNKLIHQAWKNAEPGILFWDKIISESPADCYEDFKTISTNPCSELPLCAYDSCRLSAINLYAYVLNPFTLEAGFDLSTLEHDVRIFQRLMDDIINLEREKIDKIIKKILNDPEPKDIKQVELDLWIKIRMKLLDGRRTGLGQMGLADAIASMGMQYGEEATLLLVNEINRVIATASYKSSIEMAKERGAFPIFNYDSEKNNPYLQRIINTIWDEGFTDECEDYKISGRRNIANLTIAPTGSISILAGVSSGIEPVFALSYTRKRKVTVDNPNKKFQDKQGDWWEEYEVFHPKFNNYLSSLYTAGFWDWYTNNDGYNFNDHLTTHQMFAMLKDNHKQDIIKMSPYGKSTAHEINPYTKLALQAVIQPWIDHSISVTYNLPKETTEEQVGELYMRAWKLGLKGLTVYRDGSREGILTTKKEQNFNHYDAPKRPKDLPCDVYNIMAKGRSWKVFIGLYDNRPYEVFAVNGTIDRVTIDKGILRRLHSGRYDLINSEGVIVVEDITHNMTQEEEAFTRTISWALRHGAKLQFGIEQLNKSEGDITSFAKAIARVLKKYCKDGEIRGNKCPTCGNEMVSEGGCLVCKSCGNNKCD